MFLLGKTLKLKHIGLKQISGSICCCKYTNVEHQIVTNGLGSQYLFNHVSYKRPSVLYQVSYKRQKAICTVFEEVTTNL